MDLTKQTKQFFPFLPRTIVFSIFLLFGRFIAISSEKAASYSE